MGRGFLSGLFWGLIAVIFGAWGLSQIGGQTVVLAPPEAAVDTVSSTTLGQTESDGAGDMLDVGSDEPVSLDNEMSLDAAAEPETTPQADRLGTAQPETGTASNLDDAPAASEQAAVIGQESEPVETADAVRPSSPTADNVPEVTNPPEVPTTRETSQTLAQTGAPDDAAAAPATGSAAPEIMDTAETPDAPEADTAPVVDFSSPQVVETPPDSEAPAQDTAMASAEGNGEESEEPAKVEVNRLTGADEAEESAETEPAQDAVTPTGDETAEEFPPGTPALFRFARGFENPERKPLMGIILITDARGVLSTNAQPLPFPVSYAIDGSSFAATGLMDKARAADQEVLAIAPLDPAASATDVAVNLEVYLKRVNQAVAIMDEPIASFQASRDIATAVAAQADLDGHGIVTFPRGLNSGVQVAEREGIPVALVFREFDNAGQDRSAMKRFLDQAAFRAGQQSGVILVGHDRPETIAALMEWRLGTRAEGIALAPISALLRGQ